MKENKIDTITNLFESSEIRSIWDNEKEDYYFSVVDVYRVISYKRKESFYCLKLG